MMHSIPKGIFRVGHRGHQQAEPRWALASILSACFALISSGCGPTLQEPKSASTHPPAPIAARPQQQAAPAPLAPSPAVHTAPKIRTDSEISNAVDYTLLTDAALENSPIDVAVNEGIVTLSGAVDNLMAKERATALAETIRGVRAVVNDIALNPASRTDSDLRKDVESALLYDAATDSYPIKPEVKAGIVTLSGTVPSYREKQLAIFVTKGVKGVRSVKDSISIADKGKRPDGEIATELERTLGSDVWIHPDLITISVRDGVVTLFGTVGSPTQYERANQLAWTSGVKAVHAEGLKVDPWFKPMDQRNKTVGVKSDAQIKQAIQDALLYDPRVSSFNVRVDVENGVVTLSGAVDNLKARRAAESDAKNTWGVSRTRNLLKNRPLKKVSDEKLVQNIAAALFRDPVVDDYEIKVKAKNGIVVLTGTVDSNYQSALADDIASRANGVVAVRNNLTTVTPTLVYYDLGFDPDWSYLPPASYWTVYRLPNKPVGPFISDAVLKDDIQSKILWSPWLNLDDITVTVANGAVTLTGFADSRFEINKAGDYAYEAGALQVFNIIQIR